ncbi:MAG: UDP-N-acetylmuramate dehydrogenase [bacterium]|nr:UDP-N-acetylmuramate dehydrogenase [bacterium]
MLANHSEIISDYELKPYTTLKVGGNAQKAYLPVSVGSMIDAIKSADKNGEEYTIIGAGSNLLISSQGVEGATILTKNLKDVIQIEDNKIYALCGAKSSAFSKAAYDAGLKGAEFLIGIPGSIGGAIYMNAGAHGQNIKDIIESVKVLDMKTYEILEIPAHNLDFTYRSSTFMKKKYIILSGIFKMDNGDKNQMKELMDFHVNYRAEHHPPLTEYSAGSTFRNPEGDYAANLLEKVGAKEYIENGRVRFSQKHANFLYNFNNASSDDVVRLMYTMWDRVYKEFNIKLHPEIRFVGKKTVEEEKLWKIMTKQ